MMQLFRRKPVPEAVQHAQSIMDVPETHLSHGDKILYSSLAAAGSEVWAYHSGPPPVVWNLWHAGVRIVLPPLAKCWRIMTTEHQDYSNYVWWIVVERHGEQRDFLMSIEPSFDPAYKDYEAWAQRRILAAVNHCAQFDIDPVLLHNTVQ